VFYLQFGWRLIHCADDFVYRGEYAVLGLAHEVAGMWMVFYEAIWFL
jgi:hypothetical protein